MSKVRYAIAESKHWACDVADDGWRILHLRPFSRPTDESRVKKATCYRVARRSRERLTCPGCYTPGTSAADRSQGAMPVL